MVYEYTLKNTKKTCDLNSLNQIHSYTLHAQKKYSDKPRAKFYVDITALKIQPYKPHKKAQSTTPLAVLNECSHGSTSTYLSSSFYLSETQKEKMQSLCNHSALDI